MHISGYLTPCYLDDLELGQFFLYGDSRQTALGMTVIPLDGTTMPSFVVLTNDGSLGPGEVQYGRLITNQLLLRVNEPVIEIEDPLRMIGFGYSGVPAYGALVVSSKKLGILCQNRKSTVTFEIGSGQSMESDSTSLIVRHWPIWAKNPNGEWAKRIEVFSR